MASFELFGEQVLVYDPKESTTCAARAVHLHNNSSVVLAPGTISVVESERLVAQCPFTPMLPNDDQLVGYGQDSTHAISCETLKTSIICDVSPIQERVAGGKTTIVGAKLKHLDRKMTTYSIRNNSRVGASIAPLYIDHSADVGFGGYAIETTERAIKKTTAFTRYRFDLAPGEEATFLVEEVVTHSSLLRNARSVKDLLESPQFRDGGSADVLSNELRTTLEKLVASKERATRLDKVASATVTPQELTVWREQGLLPTSILDLLTAIAQHEAKRTESTRVITAHQASIEATFNNQERLRENIKSLETVGKNALTDRYLADLDKEEDGLINTRRAIAALQEEDSTTKAMLDETKLCLSLEVAKLREELVA